MFKKKDVCIGTRCSKKGGYKRQHVHKKGVYMFQIYLFVQDVQKKLINTGLL